MNCLCQDTALASVYLSPGHFERVLPSVFDQTKPDVGATAPVSKQGERFGTWGRVAASSTSGSYQLGAALAGWLAGPVMCQQMP